ncbi:unnamed protein product [Adineta steineri]|uniref:Uncharacterized protein n=2 Tax=Adineta steineri TaxID=433720 RepID=A0A813NK85_9BILA|nr:unnamed protein product [Adineta steineri]
MSSSGDRFTDIELENKRLPACFGYITWKLLSLEDTMKELQDILQEINRFVKLAKKYFVDHLGQIYVADCGNNRVVRWCEGDEEGEAVVGGNGEGNQSNQLYSPTGLSFDNEENLYVADQGNRRIQKYEKNLN